MNKKTFEEMLYVLKDTCDYVWINTHIDGKSSKYCGHKTHVSDIKLEDSFVACVDAMGKTCCIPYEKVLCVKG